MKSKNKKGFYYDNTVEINYKGKKVRVNKFEAHLLDSKRKPYTEPKKEK